MIRSHVTRNDDPPDEPDSICECCGRNASDCICPECPTCGEVGNPDCYTSNGQPGHNRDFEYTLDQRLGVLEYKFEQLKTQLDELFFAAETGSRA